MFGDSDGSKDPSSGAPPSNPPEPPFPNRELTLSSYLCDKPPLASAAAAGRSSPPNPAAATPADDAGANAKLCVERDFLNLSTPKRGDPPGDDSSVVGGKKPRLDSLQLSLSLPSDAPAPPSSSQPPSQLASLLPAAALPVDGDLRAAAAPPPRRTYSATTGRTRSINSDDMSYSYSVFSHNPSCSLTHNSTDIYAAGEGTNGSVHSRFNFRPMGDGSVAFATAPLKEGTPSFFPTELPARMVAPVASVPSTGGSFDGSRGGLHAWRPERILREIVSDSVAAMAQVLQDFPSETLEVLREAVRGMIDAPEKRDELASLQRKLERRSDLTAEALGRANKTQLEILVAIKTGMAVFVTGKGRVSSSELAEMFLMTRCRNLNCKSALPVDDCECKICATRKGFCSACMCPVCQKFDCAANTCSWVGCDVCSHWCHAACALERNLIRPGPTLKGAMGTTEMQFQCLGCNHASEMFGFVKEVFNCCAENWAAETLMKEMDFVRRIFAASEDFEGKGLHARAEEVLSMLSKKTISPSGATKSMLQFFKYGVTDYSVTGSKSKGVLAVAQTSQSTDMLHFQTPTITPPKPSFNFKPSTSILDTQLDALKASPKPLSIEPHFSSTSKDDDSSSLETIVKCKEAEAKLFQKLADDARKEVENYHQIIRTKTQKLEEEYATKLAKLCFQETEEKRRKKMEELKMLENSHYDYHKMKLRMQTEIQGLLERMEATKKMWV
ncbi:protein TITANIA-like [Phragmites australis]|uniref:protein TITANIA-like n=1 Tax=Phragmites australis TaxID=29695 RepID=UPI002D77B1A3|nr:protein TITANIA-like [Phragmites australis]